MHGIADLQLRGFFLGVLQIRFDLGVRIGCFERLQSFFDAYLYELFGEDLDVMVIRGLPWQLP